MSTPTPPGKLPGMFDLISGNLEPIAMVFGLVSVWLSTRQHIASWPTALVNVGLYGVIFYRAQLLAGAGLQIVYFTLSLYGWYQWKFGGENRTELKVSRAGARHALVLVPLGIVAALALGFTLSRQTTAALPWLDSVLTVASLTAQWMMTRKLLQSWIIWIVVNVAYVAMFINQDLRWTAVQYSVFLILAVWGYIQWRRSIQKPVRVVIIGPEASGKTTLAAQLAAELNAPWVPEAARLFAESHDGPLSLDTVEPIARLSIKLEDAALSRNPRMIIRDTDLISTVVYSQHYYGTVAPWIVEEARARLADLYLLFHPDLPWSSDGIRDSPVGREELFAEFRSALESFGASYREVSGGGDERREAARNHLRQQLGI